MARYDLPQPVLIMLEHAFVARPRPRTGPEFDWHDRSPHVARKALPSSDCGNRRNTSVNMISRHMLPKG
ncbi:MAG: hypothetical protein JWN70_5664 [Planctomycetaceae bacterium]|nr:hypothetical protein [Planctomycetaceae bacterium]